MAENLQSNGQILKERLRKEASELGLEAFGVAAIPADVRAGYFKRWLADGRHAEMNWLARDPERRSRPELVLEEAQRIIVLGQNYYQKEPQRRGRIAKYALGADYHKVLLKKLKA